MSLADVGKAVGVTRAAVQHWEAGRSMPSGPAIRQLASLFRIEPDTVAAWFSRPAA